MAAGTDQGRLVDLWRLDEVLHDSRTPYQDVLVARTDQNPQSA